MSEDIAGQRVSVGRAEIEELRQQWLKYLAVTRGKEGPVDPVRALQYTGAVLRSVDRVLATLEEDCDTVTPARPTPQPPV